MVREEPHRGRKCPECGAIALRSNSPGDRGADRKGEYKCQNKACGHTFYGDELEV